MFTGIIEASGIISAIVTEGTNVHFDLKSALASELKIDQSLAHDGVCLTVVRTSPESYRVTAIHETISKTNLAEWKVGKSVNLERCMPANGRFDGHIVQGHVDQTGKVKSVIDQGGSWLFEFEFEGQYGNVTVEKDPSPSMGLV
jgi:riboflavin synthase